ncbi:MAG: hypothetical protein ACM31E_01845 [Fibrobacterota bacterium]
MNQIKIHLINKARELYTEIHPCTNMADLSECFTTEGGLLIFWFNTSDSSTHVMSAEID